MRTKTSIYDFSFIPSGYGHYKVTYTSPRYRETMDGNNKRYAVN